MIGGLVWLMSVELEAGQEIGLLYPILGAMDGAGIAYAGSDRAYRNAYKR